MNRWILPIVFLACFLAAPVYAEDVDIYFNTVDGDSQAPVNLVLLMDTSGSMSNSVCTDDACTTKNAKINELQIALRRVIDSLGSNARIGLGRYNKSNVGGRLIYPVRGLDEVDNEGPVSSAVVNDRGDGYQYLNGSGDLYEDDMDIPNEKVDGGKTGFVFEDLDVPRYAAVKNAYIEIEANESSSTPISIDLGYENIASSELFSSSNDIISRNWVMGYREDVTEYWQNVGKYQIDVTKMVQDAVNRVAWCGGNNLAIAMTNAIPGDTSTREIETNESGTAYPAILKVEWDHTHKPVVTKTPTDPDYGDELACGAGITANIGSPLDDGVELSDGSVELEEKYLDYSAGDYGAALRFPRLSLDGRATAGAPDRIQAAYLHVLGRTNRNTNGDFVVRAMVGGSTMEFVAENGHVSERELGNELAIHNIGGNFKRWHQIEITSVLQEIISDPDWVKNSDFGLLVELNGTGSRDYEIYSSESGAATAPYVTIQALSSDPATFLPRVRDRLKEQVNELTADGGTPTMESYSEMARYLLGYSPKYALPFDDAVEFTDASRSRYLSPHSKYPYARSCTSNHIVTLSDGMPTNDGDFSAVTDITGRNSCTNSANSQDDRSYNCQIQLSEWLADGTKNGLGGPITTHSIGFDVPPDLEENFRRVAHISNGQYASARNATELEAVFQNIINNLTTANTSLAAPGVAVNQLSRLEFLDQTYYSVFKPNNASSVWAGNLKRYRLGLDGDDLAIFDQTGLKAVDPNTGFFKDAASSWWDSIQDGPEVSQGGARNQVTPATRKLYVATSSPSTGGSKTADSATGTSLLLYDQYSKVSKEALGLAPTASDEKHQKMHETLLQSWGDPLHSIPVMVNYGYTGSYDDAISDADKQNNVVFVSTNDGMLHAIEAKTGKELSVFMPKEILEQTAFREAGPQLQQPGNKRVTYGLDGSWSVWRKGATDSAPEKVYLFGGMRRGGQNYYALDYTNPEKPQLLWVMKGGEGDFGNMGQSWADPTFGFIKVDGDRVPVLAIGGGYSPENHDNAADISYSDKKGNAIYLVNAMTGAVIWKQEGGDLKWSIPASVATVDVNLDKVIDFLYAVDLGGQIVRVDINNDASTVSDVVERSKVIAKLGLSDASGKKNQRRFFSAPAIQLGYRNGQATLQVLVGSGARPHPMDEQTEDRFYAIDDFGALTHFYNNYKSQPVVTHSDLLDVTDDYSATLGNEKGFYITLERGEKVLAQPTALFGLVYFTTFVTETKRLNDCASIPGGGRAYIINAMNGAPAADFDNDGQVDNPKQRYEDIDNQGIPPQPQIILPPSGSGDDSDQGGGSAVPGQDECPDFKYAVLIGTSIVNGNTISACGVEKRQWRELDSQEQADERIKKYSGGNP
ncbi:MAG: PilC/PilY family type IV pilus protein [Pseudomonadota bacterium]|nr:PilC/PilY family type IV pilus protein [Pseudomonadota bacterium]